jgi:hypothetical protein
MCFIRFNWIFNLDNVAIRANANVNINENKPSDAREVLAYYNREQYGSNLYFMVLSTLRFLQV